MYEQFFSFTEAPFQLVPNARFFFPSSKHKRAADCLKFGLNHGEGFVVITGEVGAGKTTLIAHLLATLQRDRYAIATVVSTQVSAQDLLCLVADSFGVERNGSKAELLLALQGYFESCTARNVIPVIIVDEAQNLPMEALEELRMLSNFRLQRPATLLTVLMGQPQFRDKIAHSDLLQLRQRVVVSYHLTPMSRDETGAYIHHRLHHAGWKGDPLIAEEAFWEIYWITGGIPRLINLLVSRVLLHLYLEERHDMLVQDIKIVAEDMATEIESWATDVRKLAAGRATA